MNPSLKRFGFQALGTHCEIQLYDQSRIDAKQQVRRLTGEILRLEQKYSRFRRDSLTTEINFTAGSKLGMKIDKETRQLFRLAEHYYQLSDGLFDITAGILWRVWDFDKPRVPTQEQLDALLPRIGFERIGWRGARLLLPAQMEVDFTALLARYAADNTARLARDLGLKSGLINLGGVFAVIGVQPDGTPWPVGIVDASKPDTLLAKMSLSGGGLASSGDYNGLVEHQGQQYRRILNPKTGWPGDGLQAVSVIAEDCVKAGVMADIAMCMEQEAAVNWLQQAELEFVWRSTSGELGGPGLRQTETA